MNIIEAVKQIITDYPEIENFTNKIHVDFTDNDEESNFGLYSTGDSLVKKDILGNQLRSHNFILYALNQAYNDYDRIANSSFMLDLSHYLESIKDNYNIEEQINGETFAGKVKTLKCANGMLFDVPTGDINDGVTYQLQIYAEYTLNV